MDNTISLHLQEVIFSSSNPEISQAIGKLTKSGELRKIAPRIYTPNFDEDPGEIIRRNIFKIIGQLYAGTILSRRSALEYKPTSTGDLFLTSSLNRKIGLPGVILSIIKGPVILPGDNVFSGQLHVSQQERALLENLQSSKKVGATSKALACYADLTCRNCKGIRTSL